MATDIQDWTTAVNITGGSVAIAGTATVTIVGTTNVAITGQPTVILGAGTASVGSISAIGSTVTVAGTINIGNVPAVTISGTPTVNINSGTVSITGTPVVNVQAANGVTIYGPNLMPAGTAGPILASWADAGGGNTTVAFLANGQMQFTCTGANPNGMGGIAFAGLTGAYALRRVNPGEVYHVSAQVIADTVNDSARLYVNMCDATGALISQVFGGYISTPVGTWTQLSLDVTIPAGTYFLNLTVNTGSVQVGHVYRVSNVGLAVLGSFSINAQQGSLPATIKVNVVDTEAVSIPLAGAQAFVDFAAVAGRSYVVQIATGTMFQATGAAWSNIFGVYDGLNTLNANCLWGTLASISAVAADKDRVHATDLGIIVPVGHATRIGFSSVTPGTGQMAAAGVYLQ